MRLNTALSKLVRIVNANVVQRTVGVGAALWIAGGSPASAHGFGQRFDLPLPLWLWVSGAGASIVLSFLVMAVFVRRRREGAGYPRLNLLRVPVLAALASPAVVAVVRALGVAVFALTIATALFGSQNAYANFSVTMVWVIWWVGFAFVCALIGNIWDLVNPLRTLFAWAESVFAAATGGHLARNFAYPPWLGVWPAVGLFSLFAWLELIWANSDFPSALGRAIVGYSLVTWAGMFLWGRETWLRHGEAFTVAFGVLARFAPLDVPRSGDGQRRLDLRLPGAGLLATEYVNVSYLVFVLLMLSSVTFDGFLETPLYRAGANAFYTSPSITLWLFRLSEWGMREQYVISTFVMLLFPAMFLTAFWLTSWAMAWAVRCWGRAPAGVTATKAAHAFVLTLVPIAVAYHLAHYFSFLVTTGQFMIPLASDPFGYGWDLLGTGDYRVYIGLLSPYVFWYAAVTLIIVGHIIAVYVAHVVALRVFERQRDALVSQVPMVLLMVVYTMSSLWILAQPIVG